MVALTIDRMDDFGIGEFEELHFGGKQRAGFCLRIDEFLRNANHHSDPMIRQIPDNRRYRVKNSFRTSSIFTTYLPA